MSTESSVACPKCGVLLPTGGLASGVAVQCARCGNQFILGSNALVEQATSGKAVASLVLGLIPVPVVTGVMAVILGIWALFDIRRRPGELKGNGLAVSGIVLGCVCSLVCTPIVGGSIWFFTRVVQESQFTEDPVEIEAIADKIGQFQAPDGIDPLGALDTGMLGWRMVVYGDEKERPAEEPDSLPVDDTPRIRHREPGTILMIMQFPAVMAANQKG